MVAGMLMPLRELRAIYEVLFRDGVMVAKKDKRPQVKHLEIQGVSNLQVIRAMGSLKSRGFVKETFAWRHFYWYLTNEGIVYLRDFLKLPPEIVPASLQRVRKPAAAFPFAQRSARVQTVDGPTSYVPKPGRRADVESQDALAERQVYRRRGMESGDGERGDFFDKTPRFRGRPLGAEAKPSREAVDNSQSLFTNGYKIEESRFGKVFQQQAGASGDRPRGRRFVETEKGTSSSQFNNDIATQDGSKSVSALPLSAAAASGAVALKVLAEASPPEVYTNKPLKVTEEKTWKKMNTQVADDFGSDVSWRREKRSMEQNVSNSKPALAKETTSLFTKPVVNQAIIESKVSHWTSTVPDQVSDSDTSKPVVCADGVQIPQKAKGAAAEQTRTVADSATFASTVDGNLAAAAPARTSKQVQVPSTVDKIITEQTKMGSDVIYSVKSPEVDLKTSNQECTLVTSGKLVTETSCKSKKKSKKSELSTSSEREEINQEGFVEKKILTETGKSEGKPIKDVTKQHETTGIEDATPGPEMCEEKWINVDNTQGSWNEKTSSAPALTQELNVMAEEKTIIHQMKTETTVNKTPDDKQAVSGKSKRKKKAVAEILPSSDTKSVQQSEVQVLSAPKLDNNLTPEKPQTGIVKMKETGETLSSIVPPVERTGITTSTPGEKPVEKPVSMKSIPETFITQRAESEKVIPPVNEEQTPEGLKATAHEPDFTAQSDSQQEAAASSKSRRKKKKSVSESPKDASPESKKETEQVKEQKTATSTVKDATKGMDSAEETSENGHVEENITLSKTTVSTTYMTVTKSGRVESEEPEISEKTVTQLKIIQESVNEPGQTANVDVAKAGKRKHPRIEPNSPLRIIHISPPEMEAVSPSSDVCVEITGAKETKAELVQISASVDNMEGPESLKESVTKQPQPKSEPQIKLVTSEITETSEEAVSLSSIEAQVGENIKEPSSPKKKTITTVEVINETTKLGIKTPAGITERASKDDITTDSASEDTNIHQSVPKHVTFKEQIKTICEIDGGKDVSTEQEGRTEHITVCKTSQGPRGGSDERVGTVQLHL